MSNIRGGQINFTEKSRKKKKKLTFTLLGSMILHHQLTEKVKIKKTQKGKKQIKRTQETRKWPKRSMGINPHAKPQLAAKDADKKHGSMRSSVSRDQGLDEPEAVESRREFLLL